MEFLLATNGGHPVPDQFRIPDCSGVSWVDCLYGLQQADACDIERQTNERRESLPVGFVVIGTDRANNHLLLSTRGETHGQLYYWDAGYHFEASDEESGNTYLIPQSIQEFMKSLTPPTPWLVELNEPLPRLPESFWDARRECCDLLTQQLAAVGNQLVAHGPETQAEVRRGSNSVALRIWLGAQRLVIHALDQDSFDLYELVQGDDLRARHVTHTRSLAAAKEQLIKTINGA
jgi:hypothetical protein